jgi:hypothetical protein
MSEKEEQVHLELHWKLPGTVLIGDAGSDSVVSSLSSFMESSDPGLLEGLGWSLLEMCSRLAPSTEDNDDVESPCLREGVERGLCLSTVADEVAASCATSFDATDAVDILLRNGFLTGS